MNRPVIIEATWERIVLHDDAPAIYILTDSDGSREVFLLPNKAPLTPRMLAAYRLTARSLGGPDEERLANHGRLLTNRELAESALRYVAFASLEKWDPGDPSQFAEGAASTVSDQFYDRMAQETEIARLRARVEGLELDAAVLKGQLPTFSSPEGSPGDGRPLVRLVKAGNDVS